MYRPLVIAPRKIALRALELPGEPGPDEVLCRTRTSLISAGTELHLFEGNPLPEPLWAEFSDLDLVGSSNTGSVQTDPGRPAQEPRFPATLGYNNVAEVVRVGPDVDGLAPGDVVMSTARHQSHYVSRAWEVVKVPAGVPDEAAAFAYIATLGLHALRACGFQPGLDVAVVGLGLVGACCAAVARACGAERVTGLDTSEQRRRLAGEALRDVRVLDPRELGAGDGGDWRAPDIVVEVAGARSALEFALSNVRRWGHVGVIALHTEDLGPLLADAFYGRRPRIVACGNDPYVDPATTDRRFTIPGNIAYVLELLRAGLIDLASLATERVDVSDLQDAYENLSADRTAQLATLVDWPDGEVAP